MRSRTQSGPVAASILDHFPEVQPAGIDQNNRPVFVLIETRVGRRSRFTSGESTRES